MAGVGAAVTASRIDIRVDAEKTMAAFDKAPFVMKLHIGGAVQRGAGEIVTEAKRRAPKSLSNLVNSIMAAPSGELAWMARAGTEHAAYVEYGTGPAAGQEKYYPNPDNLLQYLMTTPKARGFKRFKRSERGRLEQEMVMVRRAQAFAWWIYQHGTKAQPFMAPAAEMKRGACEVYIRQAVDRGIREVFGSYDAVRYF